MKMSTAPMSAARMASSSRLDEAVSFSAPSRASTGGNMPRSYEVTAPRFGNGGGESGDADDSNDGNHPSGSKSAAAQKRKRNSGKRKALQNDDSDGDSDSGSSKRATQSRLKAEDASDSGSVMKPKKSNKEAAGRYRQKKKVEWEEMQAEMQEMRKQNDALTAAVSALTEQLTRAQAMISNMHVFQSLPPLSSMTPVNLLPSSPAAPNTPLMDMMMAPPSPRSAMQYSNVMTPMFMPFSPMFQPPTSPQQPAVSSIDGAVLLASLARSSAAKYGHNPASPAQLPPRM